MNATDDFSNYFNIKTGEIDTDTNSKVINEEPVLQIIKEEE